MAAHRPTGSASPSRRSSRCSGRAARVRWVALVVAAWTATAALASEHRVDPVFGEDRPDAIAGGTLRTIGYAVAHAAEGEPLVLRLAAGEYTVGERLSSAADVSPWALGRFPAVVIEGPENGVAAVIVEQPILGFVDGGEASLLGSIRLRRLTFEGSHGALSLHAASLRSVEIEDCRFARTEGPAVAFTSRASGVHVRVVRSRFVDCGTGVLVAAAGAGDEALIEVEESVFDGVAPLEPSARLGAAIDLFADDGASIRAVVRRSVFRDTINALSLSAAANAAGATLEVTDSLVTSVSPAFPVPPVDVAGALGPGVRYGTRHVVRTAVPRKVPCDVRIEHVTAWGFERFVELGDDVEGLRSLEIAACIARGRDDAPAVLGAEAATRLAVSSSIVPAAWLVELDALAGLGGDRDVAYAGLRDVDPRFVDADAGNFRLLADSPAIDAASDAPRLVDLDGACGRSGEPSSGYAWDLGAFEFQATCYFETFRRGDANADGNLAISDAIGIFGFLFLGTSGSSCPDAADTDDSGVVDISDGIYLLSFLFLGGAEPPTPFPERGPDLTPDSLERCWHP